MEDNTILIIEPNPTIRNHISSLLTQLNYQHLIVSSPIATILKTLAMHPINAILLPIETNIDLIQQIHLAHNIPFIFYAPLFNPSILWQLSKLPAPVYLARASNKDDLYVNIELSLYYHSQQKAP